MQTIDLGTISMGNSDRDEAYQAEEAKAVMEHVSEELARNDICYTRDENAKSRCLGDVTLDSQGRILDLTMRLTDVYPGKRVAVGVVLTEIDRDKHEYPRGQKTVTIPAHNRPGRIDISLSNLRFVMPEDISVADPGDMQGRHFIARVTAHYIDSGSVS